MTIDECLANMGAIYRADPVVAVRGQAFIKALHDHLLHEVEERITGDARNKGVRVIPEAWILGSHKPKNVDVAVCQATNGPLMTIGVRSQMSSIGKNALNYYEGIVGECISLQDRFPMAVHGYVYLHPLRPIKDGREAEVIDHARYARMYAAISGRLGLDFKNVRGIYDQFAYAVVDFDKNPPEVRDDIVRAAVPSMDLALSTFADRMINTFKERMLFWDVFS